MQLPAAFLIPISKNKTKSTLEKVLIFSKKKSFPYISGKLAKPGRQTKNLL